MRMLQLSVYFALVTDLKVQSFQNKKSLRDLAEMRLLFFSHPPNSPTTTHVPLGALFISWRMELLYNVSGTVDNL